MTASQQIKSVFVSAIATTVVLSFCILASASEREKVRPPSKKQPMKTVPKESVGPKSFRATIDPRESIPIPIRVVCGYEVVTWTINNKWIFSFDAVWGPSWLPNARRDKHHIGYYKLPQGSIVRVFDGLYRVNGITFTRLGKREYPKGVSADAMKGTYWIPVSGSTNLYSVILVVKKIVTDDDGNLTATLQVSCANVSAKKVPRKQQVKVGDLILMGDNAHRVRQIVASDPKKKLIGWVDFDQSPVKKISPKKEKETSDK